MYETLIAPGLTVLLADAEGPVNLGLTARSMANAGLCSLRVSGELTGREDDARKFAVHAGAVLDGAVYGKTLDGITRGVDILIGLSPRMPWDDGRDISIDDLGAVVSMHRVRGEQVGLLFGNEARGLGNHELAQCAYRLALPTDPGYISMNLAQAVLVTLWELRRQTKGPLPEPDAFTPATGDEKRHMLGRMREFLEVFSFLNAQNPELIWREYSIMMQAAPWSSRQVLLMTGLFSKAVSRYRAEIRKNHHADQE